MKAYLSRAYEKNEVAGQLTNLKSKKIQIPPRRCGHSWDKTEYRATTQVDKKTFYSKEKKNIVLIIRN